MSAYLLLGVLSQAMDGEKAATLITKHAVWLHHPRLLCRRWCGHRHFRQGNGKYFPGNGQLASLGPGKQAWEHAAASLKSNL